MTAGGDIEPAVEGTPPTSSGRDMTSCDLEMIHIPGAIQPHGAFLASGPDGRIAHASDNLAAFLGVPAAAALGQDLAAIIGAEASDALRQAGPGPARAGSFYQLRRPDGALRLRGFRSGPYLGVDIETPGAPVDEVAALLGAQALLARLEGAGSRMELCAWAVAGLRAITGYQRVMAYRFDPVEGHGEVIAEALEPGLDPYLGLHYPASDIPAQARTLFLRQPVGAVADAGYTPVPLRTDIAAAGDAPLDLTFSTLRSVSPVHRAYMRNMGTVASLTVALPSWQQSCGRAGTACGGKHDRPACLAAAGQPGPRRERRQTGGGRGGAGRGGGASGAGPAAG
jgi:light-regulated signal transduction histidine kinase (bacteriophytochrome)